MHEVRKGNSKYISLVIDERDLKEKNLEELDSCHLCQKNVFPVIHY